MGNLDSDRPERGAVSREATLPRPGRALTSEAILGVAMGVASVLGYVFVLILSRELGPGDFGGFSSLNSIGIVLAIPAGAFQVMIASRVARLGPAALDLRLPLAVGALGAAVTLFMSPLLLHVTRVDSMLSPALVGLGLIPLTVNGALMGGLLGMRRIRALSLVYIFAGLSRVLAAALAASVGLGVIGSFALVVLSTVLTAGLSWFLCRDEVRIGRAAPLGARAQALRDLLRSTSSMGVLMALTTVDVVLARYVLSDIESGQYALASTLGRAPVWATQFLALTLVPTLARSGSTRSILRAGSLVLGVCLVGISVAASAPAFWIGVLGGPAYLGATGLLVPYLALGTLLALAQVLVVAEMARGRHILAKVAWVGVTLEIALVLVFWHDNAFQVLGAAIVAAAIVVAVGIAELLIVKSPAEPAETHNLLEIVARDPT